MCVCVEETQPQTQWEEERIVTRECRLSTSSPGDRSEDPEPGSVSECPVPEVQLP